MSVPAHASTLHTPEQIDRGQVERFDRFWKPDPGGCHLWVGGISKGYGRFDLGQGRGSTGAHRFAYVLAGGSVAPGLVVDHLCRNTACVNPEHLEAVTQKVNAIRGTGSKPLCMLGHPFDGDNLYIAPSGKRGCRTCRNAATRRYEERKREGRKP